MAKKVKLTHKEIKSPDEFLTTTARVIEYLSEYRTAILIGLGAALVLSLAIAGVFTYVDARDAKALTALSKAQEIVKPETGAPGQEETAGPEDYRKAAEQVLAVYEQYGGTDAGKQALLFAGHYYAKAGEPDAAIAKYEEFLDEFSGDPYLKQLAQEGLGYAYEAKGDFAAAAEKFEKAIDPAADILRGPAIVDAARCYEASGNREKAIALYEQFLQDYPESGLRTNVTERLALIKAELG